MKFVLRRPVTSASNVRGDLSWALVLSLLSCAATIVGVLAAYVEDVDRGKVLWVLLLVLSVVGAAMVVIFLRLMTVEFMKQRRGLASDAMLLNSVPRQLRFARRTDKIVIQPTGSGELYWHFELVAESQAHITNISLPVYVEVPRDRDPWTSIEVVQVKVDGKEMNADSAFRRVERTFREQRPKEVTEHGVIAIGVPLGKGDVRCHVDVKAKLNEAFLKVSEGDSHSVDIPYVTDDLRVVVQSADPGYVPLPAWHENRTIEPLSQTMEILDGEEAQRQHNDYGPDRQGSSLVWKPESTKLGYRYKLWFRLEQKPGARKGDDRAGLGESQVVGE